jgi:hypothetical protein
MSSAKIALFLFLLLFFLTFEVLLWADLVVFTTYPMLRMMQINNAGSNAYSYKPLAEASDEDLMWASLDFSIPC